MTPDQSRREQELAVDPAAVAKRLEQWETLFSRHLDALRKAPELERLREEGLLPKFAALATRVRALEETSMEAWNLIMSKQAELEGLLDQMKALIERRLGG
jgi:hypothetical protein